MTRMPAWIWLSGAVLLSVAEALGAEFVLLMLGAGALAGAITAVFTDSLPIQILVFAVVSLLLVVGARPALLRKAQQGPAVHTGIAALIGSKATVVSTVDAAGGQVKIGGEVWSAVGVDGHRPMPPGTPVTVVEVRGATAVVIWGP
jgi:membrane protein implicated in regulation of membrane protease activity